MIDNKYTILKSLGYGCSSKVFLVKDLFGEKFAAKVVRKDKQYEDSFAKWFMKNEHELLWKFQDHPNIINSFITNGEGVYESKGKTENIIYNLIEYAPNSTLAEYIRNTGPVEEEIARFFITQLCHAISLMHQMGYCHLDIKLENILLDEYFNVKVGDLGSSVWVQDTWGYSNLKRGTRLYLPPEIENLEENQTFDAYSADIYTLGVWLFLLLTGEFPSQQWLDDSESSTESDDDSMSDESESSIDKRIKLKWKVLSPEVKSLINWMTDPDPVLRSSIFEVLQDEWINKMFSTEICNQVYEEMKWRKKYMNSKVQKKIWKY